MMNNTKLLLSSLMLSLLLICGCSEQEPNILDDISNDEQKLDIKSTPKLFSNKRAVQSWGIDPSWSDAAANGFNNAFLTTDAQGNKYYKLRMNTSEHDETWTFALDILAMEDVYIRTESNYHRNLINDLTNGFIAENPTPYDWDGWNDDIAWMGLATIRAYQITGHGHFLNHARYCFDYIWSRGWDTQYNNGGIWEQQPDYLPEDGELIKEALSNNPTGRLAALIYQSTGNSWYLDRANDIYNWSWNTIFNWQTGEVYRGIYPDGSLSIAPAAYNQGSFVAFADIMHEITGDSNYLRDAKRAVDYTINNLTVNGILVQNDTNADTWGDEMARGLGMLCIHNPELWEEYGNWMVQNANSIWENRRNDYNLTWNAWNQQTPENAQEKITHYASALAWLQYTPFDEGSIVPGQSYSILSKNSGRAMDVAGESTIQGENVLQWDDEKKSNQRWIVNSLGNNMYSIINVNSGMSLDLDGGGAQDGANILQWGWNNGDNQKWYIQPDGEGYYRIISVSSGRAISVEGASAVNGGNIVQWSINNQDAQKWRFIH